MARMEITIYPLGTDDPSISKDISHIFPILDRYGLPYEISVMGTIVEGTAEQLFRLGHELHESVAEHTDRIVTLLRIDDRRGEQV